MIVPPIFCSKPLLGTSSNHSARRCFRLLQRRYLVRSFGCIEGALCFTPSTPLRSWCLWRLWIPSRQRRSWKAPSGYDRPPQQWALNSPPFFLRKHVRHNHNIRRPRQTQGGARQGIRHCPPTTTSTTTTTTNNNNKNNNNNNNNSNNNNSNSNSNNNNKHKQWPFAGGFQKTR